MASQRTTHRFGPNTETKFINSTGKDMDEDKLKIKIAMYKTILVVSIGLFLDLLGNKTHKIKLYSTLNLSSLHPHTASLPCPHISLQGE